MAHDGLSIRRRRECEKCQYRFSTTEEAEILDITVVKSDGAREAYSRDKLSKGVFRSLEKRSYTTEQFKKLIQQIEQEIQKAKKREVTSLQIGEAVMKHLKKFDKVAYIRFASVYRQFEDVKTFQKELNSLMRKRRKSQKK